MLKEELFSSDDIEEVEKLILIDEKFKKVGINIAREDLRDKFTPEAILEIEILMASEDLPQEWWPREEDLQKGLILPRDIDGELTSLLVYRDSLG